MAVVKCIALTSSGNKCTFVAAFGQFCLSHAARDGHAEAKEALRLRGIAGYTKAVANAGAAKRKVCRLRTTDDLLVELERSLLRVEASGGDAIAKAGAVVKLVAEARATLKASELEKENTDLRAMLIERHPELRKHLKAVT